MLPLRLLSAGLLFAVLDSACAGAQGIPFSQRGSVAQTVAFTEFDVKYGRPVARGRMVYGDSGKAVVHWGRIWNPGADSATLLSISRDVQLDGRDVAAGEYSLWLIPRSNAPWVLILSKAARVFHTPYPGAEHDALRLEVTPEQGAHMETLAIYFPVVNRDEAVLRIHWGETIIPVKIKAPYRPPA